MPGHGEDNNGPILQGRVVGRGGEGSSTTSSSISTVTPPGSLNLRQLPLSESNNVNSPNSGLDPVTAQLNLVDNLTGDDNPPPEVINLRRTDIRIGRAADCQVTLGSLQISRQHCELLFRNDKWFIRDTSTNGLTVASKKAIKGQLHPLTHQDLIQLVPTGTLSYRFLELTKTLTSRGQFPIQSVTLDSDDESLLSVDPDDDEVLVGITLPANERVTTKIKDNKEKKPQKDKNNCEPDSIQIIENSSPLRPQQRERPSIIFTPTKRQRPLSESPPPSQTDSQSSQSQSLLCNKKQKTDINHLLREVEQLKTQNEIMKAEYTIERSEFLQRRDAEVDCLKEQYKEELNKKFSDVMESEFSCCVCSGVFVEPAISPSCGHTYCHFCITEWLKKKPECPICRSPIPKITPPKKHVEMGNYIHRVYELLGDDYKERRDAQINDRQSEKVAAAAAETAQILNQRTSHQQQQQLALDMLNQMQAVVNIGGVAGRRRRNHAAVAAALAEHARAGPAPRRTGRRRNNAGSDNSNPAVPQGGLPGGHQIPGSSNNDFNFVSGPLMGINPRNARHPFFHMSGGMPLPPHFAPFANNQNPFDPSFLHNRDVLMIDD